MLQKALEFLRKHNEITFATTDGTSPKLRIFQIMHQEGTTLYFATSSKKAVWQVAPVTSLDGCKGKQIL